MALIKPAPVDDIDESQLTVTPHKEVSAGVPAVAVAMDRTVRAMGVDHARSAPLVDVLVRAALGGGAEVLVVPGAVVSGGFGALLRAVTAPVRRP